MGYNLQIKHQRPRPDIPGMPVARSTTIIRHNVFAKAEGGTTESARPNVLVGHFPLEGPGAEDDYAVYGNFFYQNRHEALFQGEGNVALYSNLFVNEHGDAIRIQPHNDIPRRILIAYNTVVAAGTGISVLQKEGAPQFRQLVTANAVFAGTALAGGAQRDNVAAPLSEAGTFLSRPFAPLGQLDLFPRRTSGGNGRANRIRRSRSRTGRRTSTGDSGYPGRSVPTVGAGRTRDGFLALPGNPNRMRHSAGRDDPASACYPSHGMDIENANVTRARIALGALAYAALVAHLLFIPYLFSPLPFDETLRRLAHLPWLKLGSDQNVALASRGLMFAPLGLLLAAWVAPWPRRRIELPALLVAGSCSAASGQSVSPPRSSGFRRGRFR